MHHVSWNNDSPFDLAILIKRPALKQRELETHYLQDLGTDRAVGFSLDYGNAKKPSATTIKTYLGTLLPAIDSLSIRTLYCADGEYFKKLTKQTKAEPHLGYVLPCAIEGYEHMSVIYGVNYQSLVFDPKNRDKLDLSLNTLQTHMNGSYKAIGTDIIKTEIYPRTVDEIEKWLDSLHQYPALTADFETFSLFFGEAGIGTVGFAWNENEGGAFCCDYLDAKTYLDVANLLQIVDGDPAGHYGVRIQNDRVRALLKRFFETYEGKLIWHNANYDLKIAVYTLWMDDYLDFEGMLEGIAVMTKHFDDTKVLTYLATNSCAGNKLSLKDQAHEFAGNYAQDDIDDIKLIPENDLLRYNLVDCLSTWYVYNKHNPTVDADDQRKVYDDLFKPCIKQILQMELNGMPIDMEAVHKADRRLQRLHDVYFNFLQTKLENIGYLKFRRLEEVLEYNTTRKKARKTEADFMDLTLNPGSPKQLQHLLFEYFGLPEIDYTQTKQPATGTKTLKKLLTHCTNDDHKMVIRCLIHLSKVDKILQAFIPNFLNATKVSDGTYRLYGGFNLGGTASGRLSSSKPNLQQIPSGSTFGKLIKKCFKGPPGHIFTGADYSALEDVANSLLTKDPAKIDVWDRGFDGHCYRMVRYWPDQFTHIDFNNVEQVNSTKNTHDALRGKSKAPSFAMQFQGTPVTLQKNCGFSPEEAQTIYDNYHKMYEVSDQWTDAKLEQASKDGYVTLAYGLRLRTPLMKSVIWKGHKMPREAQAEGRTAGNAISGQSYGLINSRAACELQERINASEYRYRIHICALIHDACYVVVPDELGAIKWLNDNLIECMKCHGLPELDWHPNVKVGAELDLFYPDWSKHITLKNNISLKQIVETVNGKK
ncbi:DNA polymerase I [Vibrio phage VBP32]|uniref:DNA polymerase I n=2 Tax=Stoningtonvirus VBP47 TaxID=2846606 RepID=M4SM00_9CAUD|nr:DNA polymerase [Vibrio phage VBP47]YP_007676595.1 DNA polymerase [Vibrio phage VBP32]AGH57048.1 DNA polymerase I [Vibrio phage VBP47]AGH57244.1 DNA polymerase I [Vibrio phage VBP32]